MTRRLCPAYVLCTGLHRILLLPWLPPIGLERMWAGSTSTYTSAGRAIRKLLPVVLDGQDQAIHTAPRRTRGQAHSEEALLAGKTGTGPQSTLLLTPPRCRRNHSIGSTAASPFQQTTQPLYYILPPRVLRVTHMDCSPSTNRHGSCREQVTCAMAMQRAQRQPSRVECQPFPTSASSHRLVGWVDRRVQRLSMGKPVAELWKGATQPLEPCHLGFAPQHYRKRRSSSFVQRQCKVRGTTHRDCCAKGQHFVA